MRESAWCYREIWLELFMWAFRTRKCCSERHLYVRFVGDSVFGRFCIVCQMSESEGKAVRVANFANALNTQSPNKCICDEMRSRLVGAELSTPHNEKWAIAFTNSQRMRCKSKSQPKYDNCRRKKRVACNIHDWRVLRAEREVVCATEKTDDDAQIVCARTQKVT